jgi:hypothetical protein
MRRVAICMAVLALAMAIGGCTSGAKGTAAAPSGPSVDLAMKYTAGQTGTYKLTSESWRTAKFEGPELSKEPKLKNGRSGGAMTMVYSQDITGINADGSANAKITIKQLKYDSENSNEVTNKFDSTVEADKGKPFAKLIGQSYTVKLMPDGKAQVIDAEGVRGAITEGAAKDLVNALFSDKELARLHTVAALPETAKQKVGSKWSETELSPRGMMDTKNFEKQYTLKEVKDGSAVIEMKAVPSTKPVEKGEVSSDAMMKSMFAGMMESKDNYTGKLVMGTSGALKNYEETLDARWFATDPQAKAGAEPDKITIGFMQKHTIEKVN